MQPTLTSPLTSPSPPSSPSLTPPPPPLTTPLLPLLDSQNGLEASLTTEQKDHYANLEQQYTDKLEELAHEQEQHRTALESQDFRLNELFAEKYSHLEASLDASKDEARQLNEQLADVQRSLQTYEQQQVVRLVDYLAYINHTGSTRHIHLLFDANSIYVANVLYASF